MTEPPAPSGNGKPPEPTPIINQVIEFKDGSRIKVIVEALAAALSKIPAIEASTTSPEQPPTRRWWEFGNNNIHI